MSRKIGVFVCHCGQNIAGVVDIEEVVKEIKQHSKVAHASDYKYMCSDPGQNIIRQAIKDHNLDGVVVAACSPSLHDQTFRKLSASAGLNPYKFENANIREQCSWVHGDKKEATRKSINLIKGAVEKLMLDVTLEPIKIPVRREAMVIGGGIAGMQSALDIANAGYKVYLVEKSPTIGGKMARLSETFPTLDCTQCILTPKMVDVAQHPNIELITSTEVEEISGYVGNFTVKIRKKATYVDKKACTGCGECAEKCPVEVPNEYELNLSSRKAIYMPFPQAVPAKYLVDEEHCIHCYRCVDICGDRRAIDFSQKDEIVEIPVGAIIVATGFDLMPPDGLHEYGSGKFEDVVDPLEFERLLSASGPTKGEILRPSDEKVPRDVVFIQCAGSRDPEHGLAYCSRVCCMYTAKHAMLYKHRVHDGQAYVFYMDIRAFGKGYEEFVQRAIEEDKVLYIRGRVSRIYEEDGKLVVWGEDTLSGQKVEIKADLVVLAMAMQPSKGAKEVARKLRIATDEYGFMTEAHPKLRPLETLTAGIFLAGTSQSPRDIPDSVAHASGAAAKVTAMFSAEYLTHDPMIAFVDEEVCVGCGNCEAACAYGAAKLDPERGIATVNEGMCEGCGSCAASCPSGAMQHRNYTKKQLFEMLSAIMEG